VLQRNNEMTDADIRDFLTGRWPSVVLNASVPGATGTVALDDTAGIDVAVEHLIALGHREIGHLTGVPTTDTARRREHAFRAALDRAGIPVVEEWIVVGGHDVEAGRAGLSALLAAARRPTAVVVANVIAAVGALAKAGAASVNVPAELSIVSFHDMWFAEHTAPALTAVRMPLRELGGVAVREVVRRMEGSPGANAVVEHPSPRLVIRGSTGPPRPVSRIR
jgi:LacI family transcriptional regulator